MSWREARDLRNMKSSSDKDLDALDASLGPQERIALIASANFYNDEFGLDTRPAEVLVTTRRLMIVKSRLFGGARVKAAFGLLDVTGYSVNLYNGTGPGFQVVFTVPRGKILLHFDSPDVAEAVAAEVNLYFVMLRDEGVGE